MAVTSLTNENVARNLNRPFTAFRTSNSSEMDFRKLIISPKSCYTDMRYRASSSELRDIKQMLLSGNKEEITLAVGRVLSQINEDECAIELINSDISEFLCDAMLPLDAYISRTIYTCLGVMTKYELFFTHNHSSFALETVIRALHFLIKSGGHDLNMIQPLNVIQLIVQGYARFDVMPEKKPFENLLNLLLGLIKMKSISEEVKQQGGLIINFLFDIKLWKLNCANNLIKLCENWFDLFSVKNEVYPSISEDAANLGCSLSEKTLRYLMEKNDVDNQFLGDSGTKSEFEAQANFTSKIMNFLIENIAPEIRNMLTSCGNQEMETLTNFFKSLLYIFKELFSQRSKIAYKLSELGFLQLIKNILAPDILRRCEKLAEICKVVLTEILLSLSDDVFSFPEMWPNGRDHFRKELSVGMSLLHLDSSTWIHKLTDAESNRSSKLALIIYFYFYSLASNSTSSAEIIHPSAMKLLDFSIGINSAPLLIKAVWFIFVMMQISKNCSSPETNGWVTKKMLEILESQRDFSLIYTHHPALLYWTFSSSRVNCRIQCEVVKQWLENQTIGCTILDDLMKKSPDVRLATFQLLQGASHNHVSHLSFSSLKGFMIHSKDDILSSNIWCLLPQILAKYTTDSSAAVKVDYMVELATLKIPDRPDVSKILRIASLLPEALQKSDLISQSSALTLSLQLLQVSLKEEDHRVLYAFLSCDNFIQRIVNGMTTEFVEVALVSLKIITILWNVKFQHDRLPGLSEKINLDFRDILKILDCKNTEIIKTGLLLIEQMLASQFKSVLLIVKGISSEFRSKLLYRLENVLFRYLPVISVPAWKCTQYILMQEKSLVEDCFLDELIRFGVRYLKDTPGMVDFLLVWMDGKLDREFFYDGSRRIQQNYFLETVEIVALFLTDNFIDDWNKLCLKILKICKHFSVDTNRDPFKKISNFQPST